MTTHFNEHINHLHQATYHLERNVTAKVGNFLADFESAAKPRSLAKKVRGALSLQRFSRASDAPPPKLPDPNLVMQEAQARAVKTGAITLGVGIWVEGFKLLLDYRNGKPLTGFVVWTTAKKSRSNERKRSNVCRPTAYARDGT